MIYFIFWVLFLLLVALAVPVASFLEKRRLAAAYGARNATDEELGEEVDEEAAAGDEVNDFEAGEAVLEANPAGDDEFSDFEELN